METTGDTCSSPIESVCSESLSLPSVTKLGNISTITDISDSEICDTVENIPIEKSKDRNEENGSQRRILVEEFADRNALPLSVRVLNYEINNEPIAQSILSTNTLESVKTSLKENSSFLSDRKLIDDLTVQSHIENKHFENIETENINSQYIKDIDANEQNLIRRLTNLIGTSEIASNADLSTEEKTTVYTNEVGNRSSQNIIPNDFNLAKSSRNIEQSPSKKHVKFSTVPPTFKDDHSVNTGKEIKDFEMPNSVLRYYVWYVLIN